MATNFSPNIVFSAGDKSTATPVGNPNLSSPFEGSNEKYVLRQKFQQTIKDYIASVTALDTMHTWPEFTDYILVNEPDPQDVGGGLYEWERTYARVPAERVEGRAQAWTKPGLGSSGTSALLQIDSVSTSGNVITMVTHNAHGLAAGDFVAVYFTKTSGTALQYFTFSQVLAAPTTTSVTFTLNQLPTLAQTNAAAIQHVTGANTPRKPEQTVVRAFSVFRYYLSPDGVSIDGGGVIPIEVPPVIRDEFNVVTDTYTSGSTPTLASYQAQITDALAATTFAELVADDALIVAVPTTIRRWMGNIWESETVYVAAQ